MERKIMYCKKRVKDQFGFTEKMIRDMLPPPVKRVNPKYSCAAKMQLWAEEEVLKVVESPEYREKIEKLEYSRRLSSERMERLNYARRCRTEVEVEKMLKGCHVEIMDIEDVRKFAMDDVETRHWLSGDVSFISMCADDSTVNRWMVNFIRHNLTDYEFLIEKTEKMYAKKYAYEILKNGILDKIARAYPELEDACDSQKVGFTYWF